MSALNSLWKYLYIDNWISDIAARVLLSTIRKALKRHTNKAT